jgi:hypothetical protein
MTDEDQDVAHVDSRALSGYLGHRAACLKFLGAAREGL